MHALLCVRRRRSLRTVQGTFANGSDMVLFAISIALIIPLTAFVVVVAVAVVHLATNICQRFD